MSHTPGPWKFKVVDETDSFLGCKRLDGGDGGTVIDLSNEWAGYPECGQDLQMTISKDDAALIAAAPDLKEALEWYAENVLNCRKITAEGDKARHDLDHDGGKRARMALEKARGEK